MSRLTLGVVCAGILAVSAPLVAQGKRDFTLINRTGLTISELYVSPSNKDVWGQDVLGRDVLANTETAAISFERNEEECVWDLKIVDDKAANVMWEDINLCRAKEITLRYDGKRPTAMIR